MASYMDRLRGLEQREITQAQGSGARARRFDPSRYLREQAGAIWSEMSEERARDVERLRGNQVARGRLRTGYGMMDEDDLFEQYNENFANALGRQAMGAARLESGHSRDLYDQYLTALGSSQDREQQRINESRRRKGGLFGGIGSVLGGLAGTFLLPGIGTAAGASLGGTLGRTAGQYL